LTAIRRAPILPPTDQGIDDAVRVLRAGGLIALPTDTVYGIAAALDRPAALRRVFTAKGRAETKPLPILLGSRELLAQIAAELRPELVRFVARFWPGPLTVAVAARPGLPAEVLAPDGTVGVRVPDDPLARRIILYAGGALAVTSANPSGDPPATSAIEVRDQLGEPVDLIVDGGPSRGGVASTVVRLEEREVVVLRPGAIAEPELQDAWRDVRSSVD
jgi:L-threonylcarbamoyladenylate synthase